MQNSKCNDKEADNYTRSELDQKNRSNLGSTFNLSRLSPQKKHASKEPEGAPQQPAAHHTTSILYPYIRKSKPESSRHQSRQQSIERESRYTTKTVQHKDANVDTSINFLRSRKVSISSNQESHVHNVSYQHERPSILQPKKFNHMLKPMDQPANSLTQKSNSLVPILMKSNQGGIQKNAANVNKGILQVNQHAIENSFRYRKQSIDKNRFFEPPKPKVIHQQHVQSLTQPVNPQVQQMGNSSFQKRPANHSGQRIKFLQQSSSQPFNSQQEPPALMLNGFSSKHQSISSIKKKFESTCANYVPLQQPNGPESLASLLKFKAQPSEQRVSLFDKQSQATIKSKKVPPLTATRGFQRYVPNRGPQNRGEDSIQNQEMNIEPDNYPSLSMSQRMQRKRTGRLRDKYFGSVTNSSEKYSILKRIKTSKVQFSIYSGAEFVDNNKPIIDKHKSTVNVGGEQAQGLLQMATLSASEHMNIGQRNEMLMKLKQTPSLHNQVEVISGHHERKSSHDLEQLRDSARKAPAANNLAASYVHSQDNNRQAFMSSNHDKMSHLSLMQSNKTREQLQIVSNNRDLNFQQEIIDSCFQVKDELHGYKRTGQIDPQGLLFKKKYDEIQGKQAQIRGGSLLNLPIRPMLLNTSKSQLQTNFEIKQQTPSIARISSIEHKNAQHRNASLDKQSAIKMQPNDSQCITSAAKVNNLAHESPSQLLKKEQEKFQKGNKLKLRFGSQIMQESFSSHHEQYFKCPFQQSQKSKQYIQNPQLNTSLSQMRHRSREAIMYNKFQPPLESVRGQLTGRPLLAQNKKIMSLEYDDQLHKNMNMSMHTVQQQKNKLQSDHDQNLHKTIGNSVKRIDNFPDRKKSVPNKSQKAALNCLSPHAKQFHLDDNFANGFQKSQRNRQSKFQSEIDLFHHFNDHPQLEHGRNGVFYRQVKPLDLHDLHLAVGGGDLSHRQLTNNTGHKQQLMRQLHHSHYSYHLQTSLLKINNEINNSCSLRNNSMESVYEDHEHDSRSCSMLHMEESTLMRDHEGSGHHGHHEEDEDHSSGVQGRDDASHHNSNSSAGHHDHSDHQQIEKSNGHSSTSEPHHIQMRRLNADEPGSKITAKQKRMKAGMSAAASACHVELKPFSQILDDQSKSCSRKESENGDHEMRKSDQSAKETVKMKDATHEEEPMYKEMEYKMLGVANGSPKIGMASSKPREKESRSSVGSSKIIQKNCKAPQTEEHDESLLEVLPGQRIAQIANELQDLPQEKVQARVNDLFFETINEKSKVLQQNQSQYTLKKYVELMGNYIEQKAARSVETQADKCNHDYHQTEKRIKRVEEELKETQDGHKILEQFRDFQQLIYQHYLQKKDQKEPISDSGRSVIGLQVQHSRVQNQPEIFKIEKKLRSGSKRINKSRSRQSLLSKFKHLTLSSKRNTNRNRARMTPRKRKVINFILKKQNPRRERRASTESTQALPGPALKSNSLYPKLQVLARKRLRGKNGRFLGKAAQVEQEQDTNESQTIQKSPERAPPASPCASKTIKKFKSTNGIKPIFQVRRKYRQQLARQLEQSRSQRAEEESGLLVRPLVF